MIDLVGFASNVCSSLAQAVENTLQLCTDCMLFWDLDADDLGDVVLGDGNCESFPKLDDMPDFDYETFGFNEPDD